MAPSCTSICFDRRLTEARTNDIHVLSAPYVLKQSYLHLVKFSSGFVDASINAGPSSESKKLVMTYHYFTSTNMTY